MFSFLRVLACLFLSLFQFYGYLSQQQNMMQDYIRTSTYQRAMLANVTDFHDKVLILSLCIKAHMVWLYCTWPVSWFSLSTECISFLLLVLLQFMPSDDRCNIIWVNDSWATMKIIKQNKLNKSVSESKLHSHTERTSLWLHYYPYSCPECSSGSMDATLWTRSSTVWS